MARGRRGRPSGSRNNPTLPKVNYESHIRLKQAKRLQILQKEERSLQTLLVYLRAQKRILNVERERLTRMAEGGELNQDEKLEIEDELNESKPEDECKEMEPANISELGS